MERTQCEEVLADLKIVLGNTSKRSVKTRERLERSIAKLIRVVAFGKWMRAHHMRKRKS